MRKLVLSLALMFSAVLSQAQQYSYRFYTISDGLPQTQITCLFQDSKGFIWIGTKGGVSRFDGVEFENFGLEDGLPSRIVCHISEGPDGKITIACDHGLSVFDGSRLTSYPFPGNVRVYMNTTRVAHDPAGNTWITARINNSRPFLKFSHGIYSDARAYFLLPDTVLVKDIIYDDTDSTYMLGTYSNGIYWYKDQTCVNIVRGISDIWLIEKQPHHLIFSGKYTNYGTGKLLRISLSEPYRVFQIMDSIDLIKYYVNDRHFFFTDFGKKHFKEYKNGTILKYNRNFRRNNAVLYDREGNTWIGKETGLYRLQSRQASDKKIKW